MHGLQQYNTDHCILTAMIFMMILYTFRVMCMNLPVKLILLHAFAGIILGMGWANENVTLSLFGWANSYNDPCVVAIAPFSRNIRFSLSRLILIQWDFHQLLLIKAINCKVQMCIKSWITWLLKEASCLLSYTNSKMNCWNGWYKLNRYLQCYEVLIKSNHLSCDESHAV